MKQLTKDMPTGFIYLIPTITILRNKKLKIFLIGFRWLKFGYTYHNRRNKHVRYNGDKEI